MLLVQKAMTVNIAKALETPGWCEPDELQWLAERAQEHETIVEVGSWLGRSTRALGDNAKGTVIAVDTWWGPRDRLVWVSDFNIRSWDAYQMFLLNLDDLIAAGKVSPMPCSSVVAASAFKRESVDMVFLDGSHDELDVKLDISCWLRVLKPGGLLCGHDYGGTWVGVKAAVDAMLPDFKLATGSIWYAYV